MLKKHQIKKIIKQMVPSSVYSNPQRKMLRETAKTELYDYITKYPDATYANLQQQFCDNEIINSKQMQTSKKIMKLMIGIGGLLFIACLIAYFIADNLEPPTYVFYFLYNPLFKHHRLLFSPAIIKHTLILFL